MTDSQNNPTGKQTGPTNVQEETHFEDETNFIDYFKVIWKHKGLILLGSVLPTLVVGSILFFGPHKFKVTYVYDVRDHDADEVRHQSMEGMTQNIDVGGQSVYIDARDRAIYIVRDRGVFDVGDWNLNKINYTMLRDSFFSAENMNKIAEEMEQKGLSSYGAKIRRGGLTHLVDFEVLPPYADLSKANIIEPARLEWIQQMEAHLFKLTTTAASRKELSEISVVIRDNFENVIPLYTAERHLDAAIRSLRGKIADIEKSRFSLQLVLETNKAALSKLKNIEAGAPDRIEGNIELQFDISGKTEYLPVRYQVQAVESKIIQVEEKMTENKKKSIYYKKLLPLNEKLLSELKKNMASYYTLQQFRLFLIDLIGGYEKEELKDYLNSYIKKIENRISASAPIMKKPRVYTLARGTLKKTAITFVMLLTTVTFVAFLLEAAQKS